MITGNNIIALVTCGVLAEAADTPDLTNGITSAIEVKMATELAALEIDNKKVFKYAEPWTYQISAENGGSEAFDKYATFAFPEFQPPTDASRQGDGDLNQHLRFAVGIGTKSKAAGVARIGDDNNLGISQIRDLVINLFDNWHPGVGFDCDRFQFDGDEVQIDSPTRHGMIVYFKTNRIQE